MKTVSVTQMAGMLPSNPKFCEWVSTFASGQSVTTDVAAAFIREVCRIRSRRELATDAHARHRFQTILMRQFNDWRTQQH
ncbi:hypothetical protein QFZ94_004831 [Paraburkholderia sp. JPY465]|uniref:hypothetical protein n=1 Tax=Paraburkholderia sp. JPY465 TaxID=3042285 RepID=UPI003D1AD51E